MAPELDPGAAQRRAPALRVPYWINGDGMEREPLSLDELGDGYKIIYCFQDWCPGCHSTGFPTLRLLADSLIPRGVGIVAIQTVFEGNEVNTRDKLRPNQERYGLDIPFGHDAPAAGQGYPSFMEDYRTGGTPWFTVIEPGGNIVHADFRLDVHGLLSALEIDPADVG